MVDHPKPASILLVEDEVLIAIDLEDRLRSLGYNVCGSVVSIQEAMNFMSHTLPDLVLMDILLQGETDGVKGAGLIREKWGVPAIFITAYGDLDLLRRAQLSHPFGFILKPFQDQELWINIEMALSVAKADIEKTRALQELSLETERFRTILDNIPVMITFLDKNGDHQFVNRHWQEKTGYSLEEVKEGNMLEQLYPDPQYREYIKKSITTSEGRWGEYKTRTRSGRVIDTAWTNVSLLDGSTVGIGLDITARKAAEAAIRNGEEKFRSMVEGAPEPIFIQVDRKFGYVNQQAVLLFGAVRAEDLLGQPVMDRFHPDFHEAVIDRIRRLNKLRKPVTDLFELKFLRLDGSEVWVETTGQPIVHEGKPGALVFVRNISARKQAEEKLRRSEMRLNTTQTLSKVGGWEYDVKTGQMYWSDELYRIHEFDPEVLHAGSKNHAEMSLSCYRPEDRKTILEAFDQCVTTGRCFDLEFPFTTAKGHRIWIRTTAEPFIEDGVVTRLFGNIMDITSRKQVEEALKENALIKAKTIEMLNHINAASSIKDLARVVIMSLRRTLGVEAVGIRLREGHDFPYYDTGGFPDSFVEVERYLCSQDHEGVIILDEMGRPHLECMCGNVISGRYDPSLPFFTERGSFWSNNTTRLLAETTEAERQGPTRNRCNFMGYESLALIPIRTGQETLGLIQLSDKRADFFSDQKISMIEDIADNIAIAIARQLAEEKIKNALQEKETLLQEIHHRVRNNMQVVISLMKLQSDQFTDPKLVSAFEEAQDRIYAMAAVHGILHQSENVEKINLGDYLDKLGQTIFNTYKIHYNQVILELDVAQVELGLERSYPIGLIFNELLSNALKYAFPGQRSGVIQVTTQPAEAGWIRLIVADNGIGFPEHLDWRNTDSLGLKLVQGLVEHQLGGRVDLDSEHGTRWEMAFPLDDRPRGRSRGKSEELKISP